MIQRKFQQKHEKSYSEKLKLGQHRKSKETKIKNLRKKFAFDEIDKETFQVALADLEEQKETLQNELSRTVENLSNLGEFTSTAIAISCKLGKLWKQMDFEVCQKIQKTNPSTGNCLG